jgi:lysophospholipase L1-like esterase
VTADLIHLSAEGYAQSANLLLEALTGLEGPR